ncbi:MAG: carboxypeptidase regulatory-like domain-containing protein [Vicinamibacterales bacterium]
MRRPLALLGPMLALALTARAAPLDCQAGGMPVPFPGGATGGAMGGVVQPGQAPARDRRPGEPRDGTAVIRGYVVAADTGAPVRRAQVRAFAMGGEGSGLAQTDADGRFEIAKLPAGRYTVSAQRSGYVTQSFGQRAPNQPGTPIEISDGQVVEKLTFALARGGAITGRVVDEFGEPVSSAQVTVQRYAYMGGARRLVGAGAEGGADRTDDLGQFRLYGLPPGEYYVMATLRAFEFVPMSTAATSFAPPSDGYAPTYYPGTSNVGEARRLTVRAGQELPNVTFALTATRVGRILGRVTTSAGEPYIGGMIMVAPRDQGMMFGGMMSGAQVRPDGTFQTAPLAPGAYTLTVQPMGNRGNPDAEVARVDVTVNGEDVRDVFIVTGRGGIIRGRVVTDDGTVPPFRPQQMRIFAQPEDPTRPGFGVAPGTVRDDWTFEVSGLTDHVRLRWSIDMPGGGWSMKSAMKDNLDLADVAVDVGPGQVVEDVEIALTRKVTELSGLVTDDRNVPVTDATVVVFPENRDLWTFSSRHVRTARPDVNGKYTVRLTPTDGYRAIAVQGLEQGEALDPDFLGRALEAAVTAEIREGESRTLDLRLATVK